MSEKKGTPTTEAPKSNQGHSTTAQAEILSKLKRGERITPLDIWRDIGCSRLGAVVHRLRRAGYRIDSQIIAVPTRGGRIARVSQYWMPGDGEQG